MVVGPNARGCQSKQLSEELCFKILNVKFINKNAVIHQKSYSQTELAVLDTLYMKKKLMKMIHNHKTLLSCTFLYKMFIRF